MKVDQEDHLGDLEAPWMDQWMVLLANSLETDQTTILTTEVAGEDVEEGVRGKKEAGVAVEEEGSSGPAVPWTGLSVRTDLWRIHLMDQAVLVALTLWALQETWTNRRESRSKVKKKEKRETGKEERVDGEIRRKVCSGDLRVRLEIVAHPEIVARLVMEVAQARAVRLEMGVRPEMGDRPEMEVSLKIGFHLEIILCLQWGILMRVKKLVLPERGMLRKEMSILGGLWEMMT